MSNVAMKSTHGSDAGNTGVEEFQNYIDGEWCSSRAEPFDNINPAETSDIVGRFQASSAEDAERAVAAASAAFRSWKKMPISKRAVILNKAADHLEAHADRTAREITREMGKSLGLAKDEILRSAQTLRFYAIEGQTVAGEVFPNDDPDMTVYTLREPLGVVSVITPWNFPISIPSRKIAPALITGNTAVFKPSSDAPLSGYRLAEAFVAAGLPKGGAEFRHRQCRRDRPRHYRAARRPGDLLHGIDGRRRADLPFRRIHHPHPDGAGRQKSADCHGRRRSRPCGRPDREGRFSLAGQACTGTSRVLVMKQVRAEFTEKLVARVKTLKIGGGLVAGMDMGPLATARQLETVLNYIEIGKREATLLHGGERLTGAGYDGGYYVAPAIFTGVTQEMTIAREEIFGPVIAIIEVDSYADAIAQANDSEYGLSAAIVTRNPRVMHDFADDIQSGTVKINRTTTGNLVNAPFGGLKQSSTSTFRESGRTGLEFYTQTKTVYRGC